MTLFIDLRATPSGGFVAEEPTVRDDATGKTISAKEFAQRVSGRHAVFATHGFNVDSKQGLRSLGAWAALCDLASPHEYIGVLWPGDSRFLPVLDYPIEGSVALSSGRLLAAFLNDHARGAARISLVSHSLGARTVLETIQGLALPVDTLVLMAGAIENDCLSQEYQLAAKKVRQIHIIASRKDLVLEAAFPLGNLLGEIIMKGHPYFRAALGREGPSDFADIGVPCTVWQAADKWKYDHGDYLPDEAGGKMLPPPVTSPAEGSAAPELPDDLKPAWSAAVVATTV